MRSMGWFVIVLLCLVKCLLLEASAGGPVGIFGRRHTSWFHGMPANSTSGGSTSSLSSSTITNDGFSNADHDDDKKQQSRGPVKSGIFVFGRASPFQTKNESQENNQSSDGTTETTKTNSTTPQNEEQAENAEKQDEVPRPSPSGVVVFDFKQPNQQQQQQPGTVPPIRRPMGGFGLAFAHAFFGILGISLRWWFLTSLARRFIDEEIQSLRKPVQHFVWERLNDVYLRDAVALNAALSTPPARVNRNKWKRQLDKRAARLAAKQKQEEKKQLLLEQQQQNSTATKTIGWHKMLNPLRLFSNNRPSPLDKVFEKTSIVIDFRTEGGGGTIDAKYFEEVVTFILTLHRQKAFGSNSDGTNDIEVILLLESPGGSVTTFGLLASQFRRLSDEPGIETTVCVDKVAASGGYMIASQATNLYAAPFAVLGSIGVIQKSLNFHRILERHGVDSFVLTAGKNKAPMSNLGKITDKDVEIEKKELTKVHGAFQDWVVSGRPGLADVMTEIKEGKIYMGVEAESLGMIDKVKTSDEYILERVQSGDRVLKLHPMPSHLRLRLNPLHLLEYITKHAARVSRKINIDWRQLGSTLTNLTTMLGFVNQVMSSIRKGGGNDTIL